jgi:hypothetical protein
MRRGLFERVMTAPFEAVNTGFDVLFGETPSRDVPRRKRQMYCTCSTCRGTGYVALRDKAGAMVAVPCPACGSH